MFSIETNSPQRRQSFRANPVHIFVEQFLINAANRNSNKYKIERGRENSAMKKTTL